MDDGSRTARTYFYECLRSLAFGAIEAANTTFLILMAVRWLHAGPLAKGLVAAGSGVGYLIGPVVVQVVLASGATATRAAGWMVMAGAVSLLTSAIWTAAPLFVVTSVVAMATAFGIIPLLTQVYQDNYPASSRGKYFSRALAIRMASATVVSWGAGALLASDINYARWLLAAFAAALAFSGWCLWRVPSNPLHDSGDRHPLRAMQLGWEDRIFRTMLISWMLMGFGNLMMLPLRVEYLASPAYHFDMSPSKVALLTGVIPNLARLVMSPVWGWLFDRANFFVLRMTLNVGFALGIASFFMSDSMFGLVFSAITFGISVAGGDVAWSLWVTRVAPPTRVADYMGVHTFFTGVRALVAPVLGFALVARWSMVAMGWFTAALIAAATVMLIPELWRGSVLSSARKAPPPTVPADHGEA